MLFLVAYASLLRVPSAAIPLTAHGGKKHLAKEGDRLVIRPDKRKHRPQGSVLKRPCTCSKAEPQFCIVHRMQKFLRQFVPGQRLWTISAHNFLRLLRAQLVSEGYANSERITLKTFRSSMATQLAKDGKKVEAIRAAGAWAGAAIMNYLKLQEIDESKLLLQAFAVSEDEGDC